MDQLSRHLPPGSPLPADWSPPSRLYAPPICTHDIDGDGAPRDIDDDELDQLADSVGLYTQHQLDAARVHAYLLFYDDHALLWSSIEQTFPTWSERRINRAIAYLEELDSVQVEPAPAPTPWSPDDALVELVRGGGSHDGVPLPWPGAHIHSPQYPATPAPPTFGFNSLIPADSDTTDEFTHDYPFTLPSSAHAYTSSTTPGPGALRRAMSDMATRSMAEAFRYTTGMGLGMTSIKDLAANPDLGDIPQTITPPSSDRWFSAEPSEFSTPHLGPTVVKTEPFHIARLPQLSPKEDGFYDTQRPDPIPVSPPARPNGSATKPSLDLTDLLDISLSDTAVLVRDYVEHQNAVESAAKSGKRDVSAVARDDQSAETPKKSTFTELQR